MSQSPKRGSHDRREEYVMAKHNEPSSPTQDAAPSNKRSRMDEEAGTGSGSRSQGNDLEEEYAQLRARLKAANAVIANKNAVIADQNAVIADQNAVIADRSLSSLQRKPISFVDRTNSEPHIARKTHAPAKAETKHVDFARIDLPEEIWNASYTRPRDQAVSIDSETGVVMAIADILNAVLRGLQIDDLVTVTANRTIAGIECDVVVLYGSQRIPFAVIEVKKPGTKAFEDIIFSSASEGGHVDAGVVAGQNFDQLCALELMGYKSSFGIITNGNKVMITARGSTEFTVRQVEQGDWGNMATMVRSYACNAPDGWSPEQDLLHFRRRTTPPGGGSDSSDVVRRLTVSQLISSTDTDNLIKSFVLFICLACRTLSEKTKPELSNTMSCRVLNLNDTDRDMRCSFQKLTWQNIDLTSCVDFQATKEIFLVYHLGGGSNGDCCLALTKNGLQCCAVKFFLQSDGQTKRQLAQTEFENWKRVYKTVKCYLGVLPNDDAYLCMPYIQPIPARDRRIVLENGKVREALKQFVSSGFKHEEILWRHIGQFQESLYIFDLGSISPVGGESDKEAWVEESLEHLRSRLQMQVSTPVPGSDMVHANGGLDVPNDIVSSEDGHPVDRVEVQSSES